MLVLFMFDWDGLFTDYEPDPGAERSCEGCRFFIDGECTLHSGRCINSPDKPYYQPELELVGASTGYVDP